MNLFLLDANPDLAAGALCDRHVVKQALETVQILATVSHHLGGPMPLKVDGTPYKPARGNPKPWRWAARSFANWDWTRRHGLVLFQEFAHRFGHPHGSADAMRWISEVGSCAASAEPLDLSALIPADGHPGGVDGFRAYYAAKARDWAAKERPMTWRAPATMPQWLAGAVPAPGSPRARQGT